MYLYFFPLIAACIGWLLHLAFLNLLLSKVLPPRIPVYIESLAHVFAGQDLAPKLLEGQKAEQVTNELLPFVEGHIDIFLREKLKEKMPAIAMFIGDKTIGMMKSSLMDEIQLLLPELLQKAGKSLSEKMTPEKIVRNLADKIPADQVGRLLVRHTRKEQRIIQLFGAVSGFLVGCVLLLLLKL